MHTPVEPQQRYWRRRANMKVRKRRIVRNAARWAGIVAVQLAVAAVLFYAAAEGFGKLTRSAAFALDSVDLRGAQRADADGIVAGLAAHHGRNLFELELEELTSIVEADPWVVHASVRRVLPGTVHIRITERVPSAIALIDGTPQLVDTTGAIVGTVGPNLGGDLPVLTGLDTRSQSRICEDLNRGVDMLARLRREAPRFVLSISELDLSHHDRVLVHTVQPGPILLLDPERIERNVGRYLELRGEIAQQVGTSEYIDLRWQDRIAVKPLQDI